MSATYIEGFTRPVPIARDSTALLVIDMQYATGSREHGLAKYLQAQGSLADAAYRFDRIERTIIPNIQRLLATFRGAGASVIYITYGAELADFSDVPEHIRDIVMASNNRAGEIEHEIVAELAPQPGEPVLNKTTMGAFGSTGIDALLRAKGIRELVCVGVSTNNCVAMTAFEAAERGYGVVIVDDATGTCSDAMQTAFMQTFRRLWGRVMQSDEVIGELTGLPVAAE